MAWLPFSTGFPTVQAEMTNFAVEGPCPYVARQEFGTYGINTYTDVYSVVSLQRNGGWVEWHQGIGFDRLDEAPGPYTRSHFILYSAFGVNGY